jgi:hypothetical protein
VLHKKRNSSLTVKARIYLEFVGQFLGSFWFFLVLRFELRASHLIGALPLEPQLQPYNF